LTSGYTRRYSSTASAAGLSSSRCPSAEVLEFNHIALVSGSVRIVLPSSRHQSRAVTFDFDPVGPMKLLEVLQGLYVFRKLNFVHAAGL
jgi:hypothetical protein